MRYRRFGNSDLVVSEVGFGTWTLASDWWGAVDNKAGLLHAALDAGITFFDTAPVYGSDGVGESLLAELLRTHRDEIVLTTKCGYDIAAPRQFPGQSERPQDWRPEAVRTQLDASLRRLETDYVDLYQLHNVRLDPVLDDDLWAELERLATRGRSGRSASRWVRRSAGSRRAWKRCDAVRSHRCRPCSTCWSKNPGGPSPRNLPSRRGAWG